MTGYEFTRFESDFTVRAKAKKYACDSKTVQMMCAKALGDNFKEDPDYQDAKHWFVETTMSCDTDEAINWMKYYMENAIAYGIETKNLDWRTKFLAAYDLFNSLTDSKKSIATRAKEQAKKDSQFKSGYSINPLDDIDLDEEDF